MSAVSEVSGKTVLVVGARRSGLAAAELLHRERAQVRVMDSAALDAEEQGRFAALGIPVVAQDERELRGADLVVVSPGVPFDLPLLDEARRRGAQVVGEVELAGWFLKGPVIGITGSNGKTTTTALTGHLLRAGGVPCLVGGNIGTAVAALTKQSRAGQWNVLELSSFQLESIVRFRAAIGACLNVTPDHLDRHHTFENYAAAKGRLFETQSARDHAVLNYEDPVCRSYAGQAAGEVHWFSSAQAVPRGAYLRGDDIVLDGERAFGRQRIELRGMHNVENVLAACLIAVLAGVKTNQLGDAVASFPGVEHRIEFVRELDGVKYYNDSKATNVDATLKALDAFPGGLWVILGGKDKGSDYLPLRGPLQERARAALLIGAEPYEHAAAPLLREALRGAVALVDCGTLGVAVRYAREHAAPEDTVLLAPACASFDQFQNYEERGRAFKQSVAELF